MTISTHDVYTEGYPIKGFLIIAITMAVLLLLSVYLTTVAIVLAAVLLVLTIMIFLRLVSTIEQTSRLHSISRSQITNH